MSYWKISFSGILIFLSALFSFNNEELTFSSKENNISLYKLNNESISIRIIDNKKHIVDLGIEIDELSFYPSQSTFYQIEDNIDISVSYSVQNSHFEEGVYIDESLSSESRAGYFPSENLVISDPLIFRGLVIRQITFYPYRLNLFTGELEVYDDVDFSIEEYEVEDVRNYHQKKRSKAFEPLYESMIINYESSTREEDYQSPAILYICGGSSLSNSYVQELIDWRHKTGHIIYTATTGEIGSSSSAIKNYIENLYESSENPPEIVGLIGDTSGSYSIGYFTESWSGYSGAGDMPYSLLDGNDLLPEVFIGRISVGSSSDLSNVINKTLAYEKATYLSQISDEWYERAALCGDPSSSGNSTVITNEYVANIMEAYGFEDVNGNYGNGNYSNWMEDQLEYGCLYMNYRGYYGSSGFGSGEINGANNGYKNPFAVFITCGTGDFNSTSLSEQLFRAGSVSSPKGAVASIGTATTGTHTLFNNIVDMGIFDGIFPKNLGSAGGAMANGRLTILMTYPSDPNNAVSIFSHWNNLIGDPALQLWTDTPQIIYADFNNEISFGTNFIDVRVEDENGLGIQDANITLLKGDDEIFKTVKTDINGGATIDLNYESSGQVYLTVTKQNCKPIEESFNIADQQINVNVDHENISIVDNDGEFTSGNGNGNLNPGETVSLSIPVLNLGQQTAIDVQANLSSESDQVNIISNINQYGNILPGSSSDGTYFYLLELSQDLNQNDELFLRLTINDNNNSWESLINLDLHAGYLEVDHIQLIDNIELNPGEDSYVAIFLTNSGNMDLHDVQLDVLASGYLLDILSGQTNFGIIEAGETVSSSMISPLYFHIEDNAINGSVINVNTNVQSSNGYNENLIFNLVVGHVSQTDPLGPDEHGYYIYDSGDLGYSLSPFYDWIEIAPSYGGPGTDLNMNDSGDGNNISTSSVIVDIPFSFTFYGETYDEITINTNGWISFGESILESFRNYPIPGAGGPSPMLAAFWDDLKTNSGGKVSKYSGDNYFVIEWSDMKTHNNNHDETFQVILYDNTYLTPTGDNEIKIQYKTFNNTSQGNYSGWGGGTHGGYSTIGIENHMSDMGLQYTFNNEYPTAAMTLSDETAILITTRNPVATLMGDANQDGELNVLDIVLVVNHIVNLESLDPMGVYMSDIDGNGNINILDIIMIINIILEND